MTTNAATVTESSTMAIGKQGPDHRACLSKKAAHCSTGPMFHMSIAKIDRRIPSRRQRKQVGREGEAVGAAGSNDKHGPAQPTSNYPKTSPTPMLAMAACY